MKTLALLLGPAAAAIVFFVLLPESYVSAKGVETTLPEAARFSAAIGVWMGVWWLTEALPLAVTSLLPLALFPLFKVMDFKSTAIPYASESIFMFFGGFVLALAMERWDLHRRFAYAALRVVGVRPRNIVLGLMGVTAFISMWVSNTATMLMMLPITLSILNLLLTETESGAGAWSETERRNFGICMVLGIAYASSIGGVACIFGTAPNIYMKGFIAKDLGGSVSFLDWLKFGAPLVIVFIPLAWLVLVRWVFPVSNKAVDGVRDLVREGTASLGRIKRAEWLTLIVFLLAVSGWVWQGLWPEKEREMSHPLAGTSDALIAVVAAILLFILPAGGGRKVMDWPTANKMPWELLLLFGGGMSLSDGLKASGFNDYMGALAVGLKGMPEVVVVMAVATLLIVLTEFASNTAAAMTSLPILASMAPAMGVNPYLLVFPAGIAASLGFMMPAGTPPNAIAYGTGFVTIRQMARAGLILDVISILLVTVATYVLIIPIFGIGRS